MNAVNAVLNLWAALKRLAESVNRLADNFDGLSEQFEARRLAYEPEQPKNEGDPAALSNSRGRKTAAGK